MFRLDFPARMAARATMLQRLTFDGVGYISAKLGLLTSQYTRSRTNLREQLRLFWSAAKMPLSFFGRFELDENKKRKR
jgi:hypothetical protein